MSVLHSSSTITAGSGADSAYGVKDLASLTNFYASVEILIPVSYSPGVGVFSGYLIDAYQGTTAASAGALYLENDAGTLNWWEGVVAGAVITTAAKGAYHTVDVHFSISGATLSLQVWFDGVSAYSGSTGTSLTAVDHILFGDEFAQTGDDFYFRNIKIGTTLGGSDIWAPTFTSTVVPPFDSDLNATGTTLEAIADPLAPAAAPEGISLAFNDPTLEPSPTWTRLDDGVTRVASYSIERGRRFELDRTDGGRATITINDVDGTLDPTNSSGPYYGLIQPLIQASISRWNPVLDEWQMRFRGFVEDFDYDFDKSQRVNRLTISLVDIFEILNSIEMLPGSFGDAPPSEVNGQIFFDNANVDDRIRQVYGDAGLPDDYFVVFSGNVTVHETVYAPGETALAAIQEAVDAEFPSVSNFYPDRFGRAVFHGRLAKFDPSGTAASTTPDRWDYQEWKAGDGAAILSSPTDTAQIRDFGFNRGLGMIRNQAFATPKRELTDAETAGQIVTDSISVGIYGIRSWSAPQLLTETGLLDASDDLTETARFAQYIVDNYKDPHNRINKIAFRPLRPSDPRAAANWKLICQVDIGDAMAVTVTSPGGGGFNLEPCFVEGVREEVVARILADGEIFDQVTVELDLSPQAVFTQNPFPTS